MYSFQTFSVPMVLQHEGHSRVVIGVEVDETEQPTALIILDPNISVDAMHQIARAAEYSRSPDQSGALARLSYSKHNWLDVLGSLRIDASEVNHLQYQLLQVNGLIETELDLQDAMVPENITIAIS
ncbi:hypothetical protein AHF37_10804 [Paragonimus kellicotti]|nr:hypothetical protein AHF37_10804 [Paragonimus kellicotti]